MSATMNELSIQQLLAKAYGYLKFRARSRAEMWKYLERYAASLESIEKVLARLEEDKLIDDLAMARIVIRSCLLKRKGTRFAKQRMQQLVIDQQASITALQDYEEEEIVQAAKNLLKAKAGSLSAANSFQAKARMKTLLYQRGFESKHAQRAIDEYGMH